MKYLKRQARTLMLHIAALAVGLNAAFRATWFGRVSWDAMFPRVADPSFVPKIHEKDGGDTMVVASGGVIDFEAGTGLKVSGVDYTAALAALPPGATNVGGVAAGYTIARGVHQQAAAIDTVVTGLTTVVAVVATPRGAPTAKQSFNSASIGNQAGAPAAGSIYLATYKSTYAAADDFTDALSYDWIAVGT